MIQKIREAERDALYDEYMEQMDQLVTGVIHRYDGGAATVALGNIEAILPRGEQIRAKRTTSTSGFEPRYATSARSAAG